MNTLRKPISSFFLYFTDEVCVFTKAKVASRFLSDIFANSHTENPYIFLDSDGNNYENNNTNDFLNYNKLIHQNYNGEILFLYRNPKKRYYSGIIQDVLRIYDYSTINESYLLNSIVNLTSADTKLLKKNLYEENFSIFLNEQFIEFTKAIIINWIEWQLKTSPWVSDHIEPYLDTLYAVSSKIKNSNVKFINIDDNKNNLEHIMKKYSSTYIPNYINDRLKKDSHYKFYDLIDEIFNENPKYLRLQKSVLSLDNSFYAMLELNPNNITNTYN